MAAKDMIQEAKGELAKGINAIQASQPTQGSAAAALAWLEAACLEKPTETETEEIFQVKCLVQCTNSEYDAALETFEKANSARDVPPEWRFLGSTVYAMASIPSDFSVALDQCNQAIEWLAGKRTEFRQLTDKGHFIRTKSLLSSETRPSCRCDSML